MNFLLEVTDYTQPVGNFLDGLSFGGFIVLLGMSIVFAVLIALWGSLSLFKIFFAERKKEEAAPAPAPEELTQPSSFTDAELVAILTAAVAAAESETNDIKFRVVSFKRK